MSNQPEVFWGEISPCEHFVQIYEKDGECLDALEGFIGGGLREGDAAVVIATPAHLESLDRRLRAQGVDVDAARAEDRGFTQDAATSLQEICAAHDKVIH